MNKEKVVQEEERWWVGFCFCVKRCLTISYAALKSRSWEDAGRYKKKGPAQEHKHNHLNQDAPKGGLHPEFKSEGEG